MITRKKGEDQLKRSLQRVLGACPCALHHAQRNRAAATGPARPSRRAGRAARVTVRVTATTRATCGDGRGVEIRHARRRGVRVVSAGRLGHDSPPAQPASGAWVFHGIQIPGPAFSLSPSGSIGPSPSVQPICLSGIPDFGPGTPQPPPPPPVLLLPPSPLPSATRLRAASAGHLKKRRNGHGGCCGCGGQTLGCHVSRLSESIWIN
jgi:hypothetical protein